MSSPTNLTSTFPQLVLTLHGEVKTVCTIQVFCPLPISEADLLDVMSRTPFAWMGAQPNNNDGSTGISIDEESVCPGSVAELERMGNLFAAKKSGTCKRKDLQTDDDELIPYSDQDQAAQTNGLDTPFAGTKGLAVSSSWVDIEHDGNECSRQVHQRTGGPAVNIESAAHVLTGPNYGHITQIELNFLRNLPIHPDISGRLGDYFPDSRAHDEAQILQWVNLDSSPELFLCVLGKVGVGKSTLAKHLAKRLRQDKRLAAEVYFGFAQGWSIESIIRMIAGQLCGAYQALTRAVAEAIHADVGPSTPLDVRIQRFILEPIRSLCLSHPLVVVLDALDQWASHPLLIKALSSLATEIHLVRFIVLGRPGMEGHFRDVSFRGYNLSDVSTRVMGNYFRERFNHIQWEYGRLPSPKIIDQLVKKADGLFIWSSTLCSLLEDGMNCPNPHNTLTTVLQSQQFMDNKDALANLYRGAIDLQFPEPEHKVKLKVFLGAVLVMQEPLPVAAFATLASLDPPLARRIQANLSPLQAGQLRVTEGMVDPASSMFHLSYLEYLQSQESPTRAAFPIDTLASHLQFGKVCLEEVRRVVGSSQSTFISPLQKYAMRYWPIHTAHGTPTVSPTSDVKWKATPHFAILNNLSVSQWQHWATSYFQLVHPDAVQVMRFEEPAQPQALSTMGTMHFSPRRAIQAIWAWFPQRSAHSDASSPARGTRHLVSRVAQTLLEPSVAACPSDAIAMAEVAVRLHHQSSKAWLDVAAAYNHAAEIDASNSLVESAVQACRFAACTRGSERNQVHWMLSKCLHQRFSRLGSRNDLDEAISLERPMLLLTPRGHPHHVWFLNNLATSLDSHFACTGTTASLDEAIMLRREVLAICSPDHPVRPSSLNNLANSLQSHFEVTGSTKSLEDAISLSQEALSLWASDHPHRPSSLHNLANSLRSHFEVAGSTESLETAIIFGLEALKLWPPGHPSRPLSLNNLANSFQSHFAMTGSTESLDKAIVLSREVMLLWPLGHPDRPLSLNNLANCLQSHFEVAGSIESLDDAILLSREGLSLWPLGHPSRPSFLNNLANSLQSHYKVTGSTESLDEAIALHKEALSLWPPDHPAYTPSLNNLANSLQSHFDLTGSTKSLDKATKLSRKALSLWPLGHPARPSSCDTLARSLQSHCEMMGSAAESLGEAIELSRTVLVSWPPGHPGRPWSLDNLANSLHFQFKATGSTENLDEAIVLSEESLLYWLPGHPHRAVSLRSLASFLQSHFDLTGSKESLDRVVLLNREALSLRLPGHLRPSVINNLANALRASYKQTGDIQSLDEANSLVLLAATHAE